MVKVLIVVDMQNDFIAGSLGTPEAQAIVSHVQTRMRDFDGVLLLTQDTHQKDYLETEEGRHLPVPHCIKGTPGWHIQKDIDELARSRKAIIVEKDTFGSKLLIEQLRLINEKDGISDIEMLGLCTDICVISNALLIKAYFPNIAISVDASGCAGVTPESHENALSAMRMCQIEIKNG